MGTQTRKEKPRHRRRPLGNRDGERGPVGLADALFTSTQQHVLGLLFGQPGRSFFVTELIALTRSGSGAVQRELKRLASSGLVTVTRIGNQKHYQANDASPVFEELHSVIMKTAGLADPIRQVLAPLVETIELALLYGSVARGTDSTSSDIDLLVVSDELALEDLYAMLAPVEASLDPKINPTLYTPREFKKRQNARNPFLTRVLEGEHMVLLGDEHGTSGTR